MVLFFSLSSNFCELHKVSILESLEAIVVTISLSLVVDFLMGDLCCGLYPLNLF